jgi:hypothetical protein
VALSHYNKGTSIVYTTDLTRFCVQLLHINIHCKSFLTHRGHQSNIPIIHRNVSVNFNLRVHVLYFARTKFQCSYCWIHSSCGRILYHLLHLSPDNPHWPIPVAVRSDWESGIFWRRILKPGLLLLLLLLLLLKITHVKETTSLRCIIFQLTCGYNLWWMQCYFPFKTCCTITLVFFKVHA